MTILIILFFISLIGISFMIGRKLVLIRNGEVIHAESIPTPVLNLQTIKYSLYKNTKKGGYVVTVVVLRFYVQSSNILKQTYEKIKLRIKKVKKDTGELEKKEASKFLKIMSDYKSKVKNIKKQIEKEHKK